MKMDENQLELMETGEIVPTRELYYLSPAQIEQRKAAGKASATALWDNTNRVDFIAKCSEIGARVRQNRSIEAYAQAFHDYLELSAREGQKIGNMTAYLAMGVDHKMIEHWLKGDTHKDDPRYKQLAALVKTVCAAHREQVALSGVVHPALSIFWQKNFDGLTDDGIFRVEMVDPMGEVKDTEEIKEKYKDLVEE